MGRITKEQQLAGLREVLRINAERVEDQERLKRTIERLEKEIADATVSEQQRMADRLQDFAQRAA